MVPSPWTTEIITYMADSSFESVLFGNIEQSIFCMKMADFGHITPSYFTTNGEGEPILFYMKKSD
jgi:hypothetical protein